MIPLCMLFQPICSQSRTQKNCPILLRLFFTESYAPGKHDLLAPTFSRSPNCHPMIRFPAAISRANKKRQKAHVIENSGCPPQQLPHNTHLRISHEKVSYSGTSKSPPGLSLYRIHSHHCQLCCNNLVHLSVSLHLGEVPLEVYCTLLITNDPNAPPFPAAGGAKVASCIALAAL